MKPVQREKSKVVIVTSSELTIKAFLCKHILGLQEKFDVTVITNTKNKSFLLEFGISVEVIPLAIERDISLIQDFICLLKIIRIFKNKRFDLTFSVTPKAGLLTQLAGFILRVPIRVHIFTGQVWATRRGIARWALKSIDKFMASLCSNILADSFSQRKFLENEGIVPKGRLGVLADGSISGANLDRFKPNKEVRLKLRSQYLIPDDALALLFLGRLKQDKGILDLAHALKMIFDEGHENVHLLIVGPDEDNLQTQIEAICTSNLVNLHFIGYTNKPENFMVAADVLCLPSYREGFGSVVIEAAACGIPSVASRIYGLTDAVQDEITGLLHQPKAVSSIHSCIIRFLQDKNLLNKLGQAARSRATKLFDEKRVTGEFIKYLDNLIKIKVCNP